MPARTNKTAHDAGVKAGRRKSYDPREPRWVPVARPVPRVPVYRTRRLPRRG